MKKLSLIMALLITLTSLPLSFAIGASAAENEAVMIWLSRSPPSRNWTFSSDDGRFIMAFSPVIDRASCTDFKVLKSDQHQVFGYFNGTVILDDGTKLNVKNLFGFAEKVENKW